MNKILLVFSHGKILLPPKEAAKVIEILATGITCSGYGNEVRPDPTEDGVVSSSIVSEYQLETSELIAQYTMGVFDMQKYRRDASTRNLDIHEYMKCLGEAKLAGIEIGDYLDAKQKSASS